MSECEIERPSRERIERFQREAAQDEKDEMNKAMRRPVPLHNASLMGRDAYIKWEPIPHLLAERERRVLAIVERFETRIAAQSDRFAEAGVMRAFGLIDDKDNPQ